MNTGFEHMDKRRPFRHRRPTNQFIVVYEGKVVAIVRHVPARLTAIEVWLNFAENAGMTIEGSDTPVESDQVVFEQCNTYFDARVPVFSWEEWPNSTKGGFFRLPVIGELK